MQSAVVWWCGLVGVTDPASIQVAVGVVAGGSLIVIVYAVTGIVLGLLATKW
jgi:hypothetical protein